MGQQHVMKVYPDIDRFGQNGRVTKAEPIGVVYRSCRMVAAGSDGWIFEWEFISPGQDRLRDVPVIRDENTTPPARDYRHVAIQGRDEQDWLDGLDRCLYCGKDYT